MTTLQITITDTEIGTPTGDPSMTMRVVTHQIDGAEFDAIVTNSPTGTSDADAAQQMRDVLTAAGVTWDDESAVIVQ